MDAFHRTVKMLAVEFEWTRNHGRRLVVSARKHDEPYADALAALVSAVERLHDHTQRIEAAHAASR